MGYALRNDRYRFIAWFETGGGGSQLGDPITATELYDYDTDPLEQKISCTIRNTKWWSQNSLANFIIPSIPFKILNLYAVYHET